MASVLVTGAAGAIGVPVCRELARRGHEVRGLDLAAMPELADARVADLADRDAVRAAARGVDALVHMGAYPNDADFAQLLGPNVKGLFNVLDAARQEGVRRVVLASSLQVLGGVRGRLQPARAHEAQPSNHYALTKLWAEQMGEMYSRCYGLSVIALRIAWMVRNEQEARRMLEREATHLYLSRKDVARCTALAVEAADLPFAVLYVSGPEGKVVFDLEPTERLLGFVAQDAFPRGLGFALPAEFGHASVQPMTVDAWLKDFIAKNGGVAGTVHRLEGEALALAASVNIPPPVIEKTRVIPKGKGMAGLAWERDQAVSTCNLQTDASGDVRPGAKAVNAQAAVALPVHGVSGELRAVVGIAFMGDRNIADDELAALQRAAEALPG